MRSSTTLLLAPLACMVALLLLSCRASHGVARPMVDEPPRPAPAATSVAHSPISLTTSDGTGLALVSLNARAVLEEPLALTELELEFANPRGDVVEGSFEILLPPGARVTRFAMHGSGGWREAEVVGKQEAREAYETFLLEERDPALLERDTGNRFRGRVFPIEPHQRTRVRVSYVQALTDPRQPYRLSLKGLPWLEVLDAKAIVVDPAGGTPHEVKRYESHGAPGADWVLARDALPHDGIRQGEHVLARVQPLLGVDPGEATPVERLTVLVDTSASRALDFDASLSALGRVLKALGHHAGTAHLQVLAFDQEVVPIYQGPLLGFGASGLATLHARRPLGASDLGRALRALEGGEHQRVLLVSDGLVSAGEHSDAALRRQLAALAGSGVERLDALVLGSVRDEARLRRLVSGPLPHSGVLVDPEQLSPERAAERLVQPTFDGLRVEVPGARWWSPTRLDGLQPGDAVMLYAELAESQPLRVQVSGSVHHEVEVPLRTSSSVLVDHQWRQGQIEGLVARMAALQDVLESERLRRHVVELSVRHRIFNDFTAFLVLETDEDYARFGLDRRALAEILVIGDDGVEVVDRREPEPEPEPELRANFGIDADHEHEHERMFRADASPTARHESRRGRRGGRRGRHREVAPNGGSDGSGGNVVYDFDPPPPPAPTTPTFGPPPVLSPPADPMPTEPEEPLPVAKPEPAPVSDATPVTEATMGRLVSAEEFRNIPVGSSTSRDFTQVVDVTPTASRDSAGIRLAGTTGAESMYVVEGANVSAPRGPSRDVDSDVHLRGLRLAGWGSARRVRHAARDQLESLERCYFQTLAYDDYSVRGRVVVELRTDSKGHVASVRKLDQTKLESTTLLRCLESALLDWTLPAWSARVTYTLVFHRNDGPPSDVWLETPEPDSAEPKTHAAAYAEVQATFASEDRARALPMALAWRERDPVDLLALVALGEAARDRGDLRRAARAYGSILDLYPSRADMRRFAAANLEALGDPEALALAVDAYEHALADRPDHPSGHRNLAYARLRHGQPEAAFEGLALALRRPFHPRFGEVHRMLADDLGIVAAAWRRLEPTRSGSIRERLAALGIPMATEPTLRITATWETDANDVDLHVNAGTRGHAFSQSPSIDGGGLLGDVNAGFGPEQILVPIAPDAFPCTISVHYYDRGPMGHGLGKVQILHHDGEGLVRLEDRPFVAIEDDAWVAIDTLLPEHLEQLVPLAPPVAPATLPFPSPPLAPVPALAGNRTTAF